MPNSLKHNLIYFRNVIVGYVAVVAGIIVYKILMLLTGSTDGLQKSIS